MMTQYTHTITKEEISLLEIEEFLGRIIVIDTVIKPLAIYPDSRPWVSIRKRAPVLKKGHVIKFR